MRRTVIAAVLAFALAPAAWVWAAPAGYMHFERSLADTEALSTISTHLNSIHTMKGNFIQIDPDGSVDEGIFYIDKPGRMRFEYQGANPILIVCDGTTIAVQNKKLGTVDHYPLWTTPLDLVLSDHLNLNRNNSIAGLSREPGELILHARAASDKVNGNITLVFTDPAIELRQWTIVDGQGLSTTVSLKDVQQDVPLDPSLFVLPASGNESSFTKKDE